MPDRHPPAPRASRPMQGRWIAGVCAGLAGHLGWPLPVVRILLLALVAANGLGVVLYLALWAVMPQGEGRRQRSTDLAGMLAFGAVVIGAAALAYVLGWGVSAPWLVSLVVLGLGAAVLWQQSRTWSGTGPARFGWAGPLVGMVLVAAGVVALLVGEVGWSQGLRAVAVLLLFAGGAALVAAPWLVRGYTDLMAERRLRIREQERTEIAAQVHDSVLQTLTLIQNHAEEPQRVMQLARSEERRLRSWLYRPLGDQRDSLAAGLRHAAAGVEDQQGATVEVVNVGDAAWSDGVEAIVAAAGEAMVNAAKHAGPGAVVSVYSECGDGWARVFVKDRGSGFCLGAVPADRRGIRDSIMARMRRVGGTAEVITGDGGTEVRLGVQVGQR